MVEFGAAPKKRRRFPAHLLRKLWVPERELLYLEASPSEMRRL